MTGMIAWILASISAFCAIVGTNMINSNSSLMFAIASLILFFIGLTCFLWENAVSGEGSGYEYSNCYAKQWEWSMSNFLNLFKFNKGPKTCCGCVCGE